MELNKCSDSLQDQLTLHGVIVENTECAYLTANGFKLFSKRKSAFGKTFGLQNGPVNHSHVNLIKFSVLIFKKMHLIKRLGYYFCSSICSIFHCI